MSKKLNKFLKNLPSSATHNLTGRSLEESLVYDLMGMNDSSAIAGDEDNQLDGNGNPAAAKPKPKTFKDIPDKVLLNICEFLKGKYLTSLRLVNKKFNDIATDIFQNVHTPILINTEDSIFEFNAVMEKSVKFPFSRFRMILQPIKRHLLITFTRAYDRHIKVLSIEPFDRQVRDVHGGDGIELLPPQQHLLFKMTGILEELRAVEELEIVFPTIGQFDYFSLPFERTFDLEFLKTFSIRFANSGFCKFSADLTLEILKNTVDLRKLRMKLPEPCNSMVESTELRRVLTDDAARTVRTISLTLSIETNFNGLLGTLLDIIVTGQNSQLRAIAFQFGAWVDSFKDVLKLLRATRDTLISLKMYRNVSRESGRAALRVPITLPRMTALRHLEIESHKLPFRPIERGQFPNLMDVCLHLQYGNEDFYKQSFLHPLKKLKLFFHRTSIIRMLLPEHIMGNLFSENLTKLELINPPAEHLTFMSCWAPNVETLILSAPQIYGDDPTYPIDKVLGQLQGSMQFRDYYRSDLMKLRNLSKLHLLFPIDEAMADFLVKMPKLWQLIVDDSKVSPTGVSHMKYKHLTYVSWRFAPPTSHT